MLFIHNVMVGMKQMKQLSYTPNILEAPNDEIVCWCSGVTKQQICDAICAGATTLEQIHTMTGACRGTQCAERSPRGRCCCQQVVAMLAQSALCRGRS